MKAVYTTLYVKRNCARVSEGGGDVIQSYCPYPNRERYERRAKQIDRQS